MSDNELSGDEIDALLNAVEEGDDSEPSKTGNDVLSTNEVDDLLSAIEDGAEDSCKAEETSDTGPMIKIYDYIRPDIFTKANLRDIHLKIEGFLTETAEKAVAITGGELNLKIESIDILSLDEVLRTTPNPCNMVKIIRRSGRILLLTSDRALTGKLCNYFLGIPVAAHMQQKNTGLDAEIFTSIAGLLYPGIAGSADFITVKDPNAVGYDSRLEPVLAVCISSEDGGRLDVTLPLTTLIEVFPEAMKAFRLYESAEDRWTAGTESAMDLWFRRTVKFPIYHASLNNIRAVIENGGMAMPPDLSGRVEYETN